MIFRLCMFGGAATRRRRVIRSAAPQRKCARVRAEANKSGKRALACSCRGVFSACTMCRILFECSPLGWSHVSISIHSAMHDYISFLCHKLISKLDILCAPMCALRILLSSM